MLFEKGKSGNPNGRPKGAIGLSNRIKKKTKDCRELADMMLEIARNKELEAGDRIKAIQWLTDRAIGKVQDAAGADPKAMFAALLAVPRVETKLVEADLVPPSNLENASKSHVEHSVDTSQASQDGLGSTISPR